ncbi:TonB-dependent receptor [Henriciella sp.]|uniref:TonB-dependent receptor n=1 Tax=Henriciella sp. TaxID=1968823 RepID=UPI0026382230|nr:TonB-dependent receptor [Henriciella sp.]
MINRHCFRARWNNSAAASCLALMAMSSAYAAAQGSALNEDSQSEQASNPEAWDAENKLGVVIVNARRKSENIQDIPVSVTAIGGEALNDFGIDNPQDLVKIAPGLVTGPGSTRGFNQLVIGIRGQRNGDPAIASDQSIGVYFAEAPQNAPQGLNQAFFDLNNVQVLRGPQGTLFGRNATGGAVLIEPNMPGEEFGGYIRGAKGNYEHTELEGGINAPLGDSAGFRLSGIYSERDGYLTNVATGQEVNDINRYALRAIGRWEISSDLATTTIGTYSKSDTNGEGVKLFRTTANAVPGLDEALDFSRSLGDYEFASDLGTGNPLGANAAFSEVYSIQNTTAYEIGDITIKNIISYRDITDTSISDADGSLVATQNSMVSDSIQEFSEEFQLSGLTGRYDYVAGLYYFKSEGTEAIEAYTFGSPRQVINDIDANNTSYSAYAHLNVGLAELLDGLSVSLGARISRDKREMIYRSRVQAAVGSSDYLCSLDGTSIPRNDRSLCNIPVSEEFTEPTWELSANWQATSDNLLYASYRRGYRTGGFSSSARDIRIAGVAYEPEFVDTYEVGSKNSFEFAGMYGSFNLAAYYSDYRDIQRRSNAIRDGVLFNFVTNAANAHISGGEVELVLRPTDELTFNFGYALVKPEYDEFIEALQFDGVEYLVDISDSQFNDVSEHQLNAAVIYELPLTRSLGEMSLQANASYRSEYTTQFEINTSNCSTGAPPPNDFYRNCYNSEGVLDGYTLVNARLNWKNVASRGFDLGLFVNNATDELYYPSAFTGLAALGSFAVGIGAPRTWGIELTVPFGGEAY